MGYLKTPREPERFPEDGVPERFGDAGNTSDLLREGLLLIYVILLSDLPR